MKTPLVSVADVHFPEAVASMNDRPYDIAALRELVSRRHVVEILDALSNRPHTTAELTTLIHVRRNTLARVLRVIASQSLIAADSQGSWDWPLEATDVIRLTGRGTQTIESLSSLSVWTALYECAGYEHER
ncbi:winged helix-turn-helix transcriptional regulator [Nocardia pseudovaccinii]|uniref:winged helix-turn-helix transcriptional regulator n=1 Tax=Nocardia pseudovaccinii TaxID=189540 RepID=UPI003D8FA702